MRIMFIHYFRLLQCLSIFSIFCSYVEATDYTIVEVDIPSVSSHGLRNGPLRRPWSKFQSKDPNKNGKRNKRWRIFCQLPLGKGVCYGNLKSLWKTDGDSSVINWSINHLPMEIHIPGYNYCGPGTKSDTKESINQLDEYCREHDMAYQRSKDLKDRHKADIILIRMARSRIKAPDSSVGERIAAQIINKAMSKKVKFGALVGNKEMYNPRYEKSTNQIRTSHRLFEI